MSSSSSSPPQNDPAKPKPISIHDITQRLKKLHESISKKLSKPSTGPEGQKTLVSPDQKDDNKGGELSKTDSTGGDESKKGGAMDVHNQLDKVCKELKYMIMAFTKLEKFEADLSEPLKTLESNVKDILTDLYDSQASTEVVKQLIIERNLIVLRSNITKVKVLIPLQHQASSSSQYLQTTAASKEVGYLPNPYEADGLFERGSFLKEFQGHYYTDLETEEKLCLLCFAIFPENAEVKKRLLRFWWVGERLIPPLPGPDIEMKYNCSVNKTLGKFVEKGFIEPVTKRSRSQATSYKMHPIIRSFIIRLAKEANFFDYDFKGNPTMDISKSKKSCLVKSEGTSSWFSKFFSKAKQQQPGNMENQKKEEKQGHKEEEQPENMENEKKKKKENEKRKKENEKKWKKEEQQRIKNLEELQTLFNVSKQFPDLPTELFSKMRNIGVLYLGRWESTAERHMEVENTEFLTGLKNMKKLRFFSLQGISGILKLPKSLCQLNNLRILDLRACHNLEELPKGIGSLKMLTYLDLSECYLLDNMPKELSKLSKLIVLKGFVISKNSSCTLEKLTALAKLEKLSINVNNDKFSINEEETVFSKFMSLKKLKIAWGAGGEGAKSTNGDKGEKKGDGNQERIADKNKDPKKQESEAPKSRASKALQKLKIPWGACGEGSSKSVPANKVAAAATAKPAGEVVKTQDENRDAKKQGSDPAKPVDNKLGVKPQESGMKLVKLDLQCYPKREPPRWVVPEILTSLKRLYIRGGGLSNLGEISMANSNKKWKVEFLRLKYLPDIKSNWKELRT